MNQWVEKSIAIANSPGYLDRLHEIYTVTLEAERKLPTAIKDELGNAYNQQDELRLVKTLLRLEKFPIKDPYVAFLRKRAFFLDYNPQTVDRIAQRLISMGFDAMVKGTEEPKEFNRQIGTLFKRWLPQLGYPLLPEAMFGRYQGIALLQGTNGELMDYANRVLGCNLSKGPDLVAKAARNHIVGEAKFLTDSGGRQNAQFEDALRLLRGREGNAIRNAILDGVVWIKDKIKMYRAVCELQEVALSALLLKDFLESLRG